ncbi:hypothetical protein TNCV_2663751 [Trichonephila clavipes]|nr:hypothetical protein TNCV_2663751 [Trichonephila clavipes]
MYQSTTVFFDSRFGRRGNMTSNVNWSDRADQSATPQTASAGLGALSPSQVHAGDEYIAENSDLFREAICARNVYAAWSRKLTNARPNDPKLQSYHQEVTKAGETVNSLLTKLNVPLFKVPASEKELDKIILRLKSRVNDPPAAKNREEKTAAAVPPPPPLPVQRVERRNEYFNIPLTHTVILILTSGQPIKCQFPFQHCQITRNLHSYYRINFSNFDFQ